jgi:uncharacterized protein YciW
MTIPATEPDVISALAGVRPDSALAELRAQRPEAMRHAQGSYAALFDSTQPTDLSRAERLAVAAHVARLHDAYAAEAHYRVRLGAALPPAERWPALERHAELLATRPVQARPDDLQALAAAGLSTTAIVTLSQVIAFVSFRYASWPACGYSAVGTKPKWRRLRRSPRRPRRHRSPSCPLLVSRRQRCCVRRATWRGRARSPSRS